MSRPEIVDDVMAERRAAGITIAPEAALHRALQERTDELERVRAELRDAQSIVRRLLAQDAGDIDTLTRERDEARAELERVRAAIDAITSDVFPGAYEPAPDGGAPTAPDVALSSAPAAGAADPPRLSGLATPRPLATRWPASDRRRPRP